MKNTSRFLAVLIILFVASSQQAGQSKDDEISKQAKLLADENISLTKELAQCHSEIDKQKKQLEQIKQENKKLTQKAAGDANMVRNLQNELSKCRNESIKQAKQLEQCQQMVDLKDVPALCRDKVEKVKKQLEQCRKEKESIQESAGKKAEEFFNKIPQDLQKENERLTSENAALQQKIAELEKKPKDANEAGKKQ
jgi:chromosome segregation ATPase